MKKMMMSIVSGLSVLALSGCGGGSSDAGPIYDTYFITDSSGLGVENIVYYCDSGIQGITDLAGAFDFDAYGDTCDFDLVTNSIVGDLYLESDADPSTDAGINGVEFDCVEVDPNVIVSGVTREDPLLGINGYIDDVTPYTECTLYNLP